MIMDILHIVLTSLGSIIALFLLTKWMGYRQISQMSMFDYINGITIGSIAAEMATSLENDFAKPLTAMVLYAIAAVVLSKVTEKSLKLRHLLVGKTTPLFGNNCFYLQNMRRANMDIHEFLSQCRIQGYFDLSQIDTAYLEPNGRISFFPKANNRPVTPADLSLKLPAEAPESIVIIDGKIMYENLKHSGKDEKWLKHQLQALNAGTLENIFLASCSVDGQLHYFKKERIQALPDILN